MRTPSSTAIAYRPFTGAPRSALLEAELVQGAEDLRRFDVGAAIVVHVDPPYDVGGGDDHGGHRQQRWCLHADEGDVAGLLTMLPQLHTVPMAGSMLQVTRALLLAQVGRTEEARAQFEVVAPLLPALGRDSEWLPVVAQVAGTMSLTGPHPVAR